MEGVLILLVIAVLALLGAGAQTFGVDSRDWSTSHSRGPVDL